MFPVYFMGVLFMLAYDIFIVMTPVYGAQLKLSASQIGIVLSTFSIAVFAMRALAAPISRHFTPWQVMLISLGISAAGLAVYGLVEAVPLLMLCAFAMGVGNAFGTPRRALVDVGFFVGYSLRIVQTIGVSTTRALRLR